MNTDKTIWVLTKAYETEAVFADLTDCILRTLAERFLDEVEDEEEPEVPKTIDDVIQIIKNEAIYGSMHSTDFGVYTIQKVPLNVSENGHPYLSDDNFVVVPGAKIYEAAERITMGCDMSYALSPIGYFTQRVENPDFNGVEWIELKLQ